MTRRDDLVDKGRPVVRPLLLQYGDEYEVQLVQERAVDPAAFFVVRKLNDEIDDEVSDTFHMSDSAFDSAHMRTHLDTGPGVEPSIGS